MYLWVRCEKSVDIIVFGLALIERHVLAARKAGISLDKLILSCSSRELADQIQRFLVPLPISVEYDISPIRESIISHLKQTKRLLITTNDSLADGRLFNHLAETKKDYRAMDNGAILASLSDGAELPQGNDLLTLLQNVPILKQEDFNSFIRRLRRSLPFYLFQIDTDEKRKEVEKFLFWSNYKGSTDLFTRYVYPPLVWLMVRPLAKARIHPNVVTWISIILTFLAIPFFAQGYFTLGFICAYGMSVLDSVDGKLARLTFADSELGNILDHGLDLIHPPMWYIAWAWGLSEGNIQSDLFQASIAITAFYILDRITLKIYPALFHRGLHTHARLDVWVRSIISRRNINLPLFMAGYYLGIAEPVFIAIVIWQAATWLYHGLRTAYILKFDRPVSLQ